MTIDNTTCTGRLSLSLTSSMAAPHQFNTFKSEDWPSFVFSLDVITNDVNAKRWTYAK